MARTETPKTPVDNTIDGYNIKLPSKDEFTVEKIKKAVSSKESLIKKALNIGVLEIKVEGNELVFNGTKNETKRELTPQDIHAAMALFMKIAEYCVKHERINATKEPQYKSEKYAMRCFLLKLGFIGDETKEDRKTLLKNLSGSSSFNKEDSK